MISDENSNTSKKLSHRQKNRAKKRFEKNIKVMTKKISKKRQSKKVLIPAESMLEKSHSVPKNSDTETNLELHMKCQDQIKSKSNKNKGFSDHNQLWLKPKEENKFEEDIDNVSFGFNNERF